jgi:hypothetical protein
MHIFGKSWPKNMAQSTLSNPRADSQNLVRIHHNDLVFNLGISECNYLDIWNKVRVDPKFRLKTACRDMSTFFQI